MPGLTTLDELLLGKGGSKIGTRELRLPMQALKQTPIDKLEFEDFVDASPRFRELCVTDAPKIPVDVQEPEPIDMTQVTPDEFLEYQTALRAAQEAKENAPPYGMWEKLAQDMFASFHTRDVPEVVEQVDPRVDLHRRVLPHMITTDGHAEARRKTRANAPVSAIATMACIRELQKVLGDELKQQAQEAQQLTDKIKEIEDATGELEILTQDLPTINIDDLEIVDEDDLDIPLPPDGYPGGPIDVGRIKKLIIRRRKLQGEAVALIEGQTPIDKKAKEAIERAVQKGVEAAGNAGGLPSFGAGFGQGEPVYESPEQAISIAQAWAENERLRKMAELFGRFKPDVMYLRSKRAVGGNDEIVDVQFGDNLARLLPTELAMLGNSDELLRLEALGRFADAELLEFATVGEKNAGRGPVVCIIDGSYSMQGDRTIWTRAVAMCLLNICRQEKRDFVAIEFADMGDCEVWEFPAKAPLDAQRIVEMASHFYGGGTKPLQGVERAAQIMTEAPAFKKADIVLIGDGEAQFGDEDRRLRDKLVGLGVRIFGIAIGESTYRYLTEYCIEGVVHIHDFQLHDPSAATAALAVQIS